MMTDESVDLSQLIDEADEIIGEVFRATEGIDPRRRHLLYTPLLNRDGFECVGADSAAIAADFAAQGDWIGLQERIREFHQVIQRFNATYTVASYWSPIDLQRRSVVHRPKMSSEARKRVIADAFAFYALTFAGAAQRTAQELFSIIHYTSLRAPQKHGIITCFGDTLPSDHAPAWLHIPTPLHGLLDEIGLSAQIENMLVRSPGLNTGDLEAALHGLLSNENTSTGDELLQSFGSDTINVFRERLPDLQPATRALVEDRERVLRAFFRDERIDFAQAAFMLSTQLLWRRACPSEFMYAFPTYVNRTCCVLTMGTDRLLSSLDVLAMSSISRSLFIHPLLLDYSINEARAEGVRRNNVFRRFLGHNLPKIIISPVTAELENLKAALLEDDEPNIPEAVNAAARLESLFEHYENLLIAFMPSERREGLFTGAVGVFDFRDEVLPRVQVAFELMRSRILNSNLRHKLQLNASVPTPCPMLGHMTFLTEILFNLVSNAVDSISPVKTQGDDARAVVDLDVVLPSKDDLNPLARIRVCDRGEGFSHGELEKYRKVVETLRTATREEFWGAVDRLLERGVDSAAREEHMGMGMVLCAAYLRSLEWQPDIGAVGWLEVITKEGEGSSISVFLPIKGRDYVG